MNDITITKTAYLVLLALGPFTGRYTQPIQKLLIHMRNRIALEEGKSPETVRDECEQVARYSINVKSTLRHIMAKAEKDHTLVSETRIK